MFTAAGKIHDTEILHKRNAATDFNASPSGLPGAPLGSPLESGSKNFQRVKAVKRERFTATKLTTVLT